MKIKEITVVGANGALGVGVSAIFASFGDVKVNMISRSMEKSEIAIEKAGNSVKALKICDNMKPYTYENLEECLKKSDFVIETIVEDFNEKEKIHKKIDKYLKKGAVSSSVTSGISINDLSNCYNEENRKNFMGIHFFNPPYSLPLCELIPAKTTDKAVLNDMKNYLINVLIRKVVVVEDKPAFLANRIGFMFINQAMQYAEKYKDNGGIDYIDTILGKFTGRNMSPLETADFVGLDVHRAIVDNIYENTNDYAHETFRLPNYVLDLIEDGRYGTKSGEGLYRNNDEVYDIKTEEYRKKRNYKIDFIDKVIEKFKIGEYEEGLEIILSDSSTESEICTRFLIDYVVYSLSISKEIAENVFDCDIAMAEGFNWIPPIALLKFIGEDRFKEIAKKYYDTKFINELIPKDLKSNYQYEKFLKAKR